VGVSSKNNQQSYSDKKLCILFNYDFLQGFLIIIKENWNAFKTLYRSGIVAIAVTSLSIASAFASAPFAKTSGPGFYRVMLGDFEVTALSDGTVQLPVDKLLTNISPADIAKGLKKNRLQSPLETSVNAYLINTGSKLVLIDTGAASRFGPTLGRLAANLKAAGYQAEQVDEIYITHMHGDHVGGLMDGDKLAFPNAIVRADKLEADFWLSPTNMEKHLRTIKVATSLRWHR